MTWPESPEAFALGIVSGIVLTMILLLLMDSVLAPWRLCG